MQLVFGIDDFEGEVPYYGETLIEFSPLDPDLVDSSEWGYVEDLARDGWITLQHHLYWSGSFERRHDNSILGYVLESLPRDSEIVRALAVIHPEYFRTGKRDVRPMERDLHPLYAKRAEHDLSRFNCADITWQWEWFYPTVIEGLFQMWSIYAYILRYLLRKVGIEDVDPHRFKLMLVWDWE
jgi:hypothetical protein